ncbi:CHY zinc finger protein [Lactiplantibacillus pentosus]|uniref:CHY zinc finger protein n=1 Tax=Lactiplantibacillus pentosus TaxID=1589 RepID=UPI000B53E66A|nr:CHY zinc finger protein [Lactiplantibacillus pentosus]ASG79525.1 hypothetical protein CEW82_06610 [Lactiplantibacillus pentosus]MDO7803508.1 CHY zinc finger protein [Lactiplantibacillus pentosus]
MSQLWLQIDGLNIDRAGRCQHYHQATDIAALWCSQCQRYYACYHCHDALCTHRFVPASRQSLAVMCGNCRYRMTVAQYHTGACPNCQAAFNPRCKRHDTLYFKPDE